MHRFSYSKQDTLCFATSEDRKNYEQDKDVHSAFSLLAHLFGRPALKAPIASCTHIDSCEVSSELVCISTDLNNIYEKLCVMKADNDCPLCCEYRHFVKEQNLLSWEALVSGLHSDFDEASVSYKASIPLQGESLNNYVFRVLSSHKPVCLPFDKSYCMLNALERDDLLAQLPKHIQPYFIALAAELGVLDLNAIIPSVNAWPLDYAVFYSNEELIFFLWDKGARLSKTFQPGRLFAVSEKILSSLLFKIVLKANDKRSLSILKNMVDEALYCDRTICDLNWQKDVSHDLISEKTNIMKGYLQNCKSNCIIS